MNYINELKQQAIRLSFLSVWWLFFYIIFCKYGWREPILLTADYATMFLSGALTFIFIGPFILNEWDPPH